MLERSSDRTRETGFQANQRWGCRERDVADPDLVTCLDLRRSRGVRLLLSLLVVVALLANPVAANAASNSCADYGSGAAATMSAMPPDSTNGMAAQYNSGCDQSLPGKMHKTCPHACAACCAVFAALPSMPATGQFPSGGLRVVFIPVSRHPRDRAYGANPTSKVCRLIQPATAGSPERGTARRFGVNRASATAFPPIGPIGTDTLDTFKMIDLRHAAIGGSSIVLTLFVGSIANGSHAAALTYDQTLDLADRTAPRVTASALAVKAASTAAIAAGRLPDPRASVEVSDFPISGPLAGRPGRDYFSMATFGLSQDVPSLAKRRASRARARADISEAEAGTLLERRKVRIAAGLAWIDSSMASGGLRAGRYRPRRWPRCASRAVTTGVRRDAASPDAGARTADRRAGRPARRSGRRLAKARAELAAGSGRCQTLEPSLATRRTCPIDAAPARGSRSSSGARGLCRHGSAGRRRRRRRQGRQAPRLGVRARLPAPRPAVWGLR